MALRADTARHIITGVTVLVFSAAAIGTAMRYQDRTGPIQMPSTAELPAREAIPASPAAAPAQAGYIDASRGSGADIAAKLDGTVALGGATAWPYREGGGGPANAGSAAWWGSTSARLTPTSGRSRPTGSIGMPGSGGSTVAGGVRGNSNTPAGPKADRPRSSNGRGNGKGASGGGPVFDNHTPSVGDLVDTTIDGLGDVGAPGVGGDLNPGGLSHTPEPTSLLLMATGVAGVLGAARRRRQARRG